MRSILEQFIFWKVTNCMHRYKKNCVPKYTFEQIMNNYIKITVSFSNLNSIHVELTQITADRSQLFCGYISLNVNHPFVSSQLCFPQWIPMPCLPLPAAFLSLFENSFIFFVDYFTYISNGASPSVSSPQASHPISPPLCLWKGFLILWYYDTLSQYISLFCNIFIRNFSSRDFTCFWWLNLIFYQ